jgi:hypothetical protein
MRADNSAGRLLVSNRFGDLAVTDVELSAPYRIPLRDREVVFVGLR